MTNSTILPRVAECQPLPDGRAALIHEVHTGLTGRPRSLSPWMFYDARGSDLFERITMLPEYYPCRIERELLSRFAGDIIALAQADSSKPLHLFELGAGTATKTGILLAAARQKHGRVTYAPCDVSPDALSVACSSIEEFLPDVQLQPVVGNYVTEPPRLAEDRGTTLAIYIGSSIGNFRPEAARVILGNLRSQMRSGDALLLGTDLVKDQETLLAAYDDSQGVTAEFNLNILRRLNRELGADFDPAGFRHRVKWDAASARIEMHLESRKAQCVWIPGARLRLEFEKGETIHTEDSHKFTTGSLRALLSGAGFRMEQIWTDPLHWYALTLARPH
ncbi:MAG: L-histidine N(alpha)-methyltransferase [Paludibaculum sp.]